MVEHYLRKLQIKDCGICSLTFPLAASLRSSLFTPQGQL